MIDWFDLAVQGILKSLLQHHSSKASILWHSTFFMVQLSHPYMTIEKTIALTIWIFVSKMMSLLFNMPSSIFILEQIILQITNKVPKKRETGIKDCEYVKSVGLSDESMGVYFFLSHNIFVFCNILK